MSTRGHKITDLWLINC